MEDPNFDLVVVGGGPAGCAVALAAARGGLSVLLIEAAGALGGSAVNCLVTPFMPNATELPDDSGNARRTELSQGLFAEILADIRADGIYGKSTAGGDINAESLKVILDRKMREAGVKVLFHATLCGVRKEGRLVKSVSAATVGGVMDFRAGAFADATGDAALCAMAGVAFRVGRKRDSLCQPMTLCFRLFNVDVEAAWKARGEIQAMWRKLRKEGMLVNPRDDVLMFRTSLPGVLHFNTTRVVGHDPTDPFSLSGAEALAREQALETFRFLKENFKPFRDAQMMMTAPATGVRESRMVDARHVMTAEELKAGTHFPDGIAAGNYDIDIHSPDGGGTSHWFFPPGVFYTIPWRSLLPMEFDNLVVAGRCIGATHEAQASVRIMPICFCTGEAAGTAVALAKASGVQPADVDSDALRGRLRENGAFVG